MAMREVVRASAYAGFVDLVNQFGGDTTRIAAAAGVALPHFERPDEFISSRNLNLLLDSAARLTKRPDFGLRWGAVTGPAILGPLHIAMSNSGTARDAIDLAAAYMHVHSPVWDVSRTPLEKREEDIVALRCLMQKPPPIAQMFERNMLLLHRALIVMCVGKYRPIEVWFAHERLSPLANYRAAFGVAPEFGRQVSGIVVKRSALAAYRPARNHQLLEMAETYLRRQVRENGSALSLQVAGMVRVMIESADCTPAQVARGLGLHERTMQRRLQEEGTTFEEIKDGVRRDLAQEFLADQDVQISHIAYRLHYTNPSGFSRACQRWFGRSPRDVRERLTAGRSPKAARPRSARQRA
jgi:AraC-like DNA-binding protein